MSRTELGTAIERCGGGARAGGGGRTLAVGCDGVDPVHVDVVGTGAAVHGVRTAVAAAQRVVAGTGLERVGTRPTLEHVVSFTAVEGVVARAADEGVGGARAGDDVVARSAHDLLDRGADEVPFAGLAIAAQKLREVDVQRSGARGVGDAVAAFVAAQKVGAEAAVDQIVARATVELVAAGAAGELVGAVSGGDLDVDGGRVGDRVVLVTQVEVDRLDLRARSTARAWRRAACSPNPR